MTPTLLSPSITPSSPPAGTAPVIGSDVRLRLAPVLGLRGTVDGAWWPHSRDATVELPGLIAAVDQRLGLTTLRVGVHVDTWDHIPHRVQAGGRQVKVGWFHSADPRLVTLTFAEAEPVILLVVPPYTADGPAGAALILASKGTFGPLPVDLLTTAAHHAIGTRDADGENEGVHITTLPADLLRGCRNRRSDAHLPSLPPEDPSRCRPEHSIAIRDPAPLGRADPSVPTTIRLSGEIDIFTSPDLREDLLNVLRYSRSLLILDLSGVAACDACGLGVLVGIQRRAKTMGITLSLSTPRPYMSRLLHVNGLDRTIPMLA
ncbi:STAS domain-containing protein [Microbispora sp. H10949]|uniref:STAS domain-containing protein n=1 Tax=Microbispora sp. H10949 TaxID=2729111 RepID=UPI001603EBF0|nr:STAS domain-containing protein [Microbispora sp. H10949]